MNPDKAIRDVVAELEELMAALRGNVSELQAILTEPEVPGDHTVTA